MKNWNLLRVEHKCSHKNFTYLSIPCTLLLYYVSVNCLRLYHTQHSKRSSLHEVSWALDLRSVSYVEVLWGNGQGSNISDTEEQERNQKVTITAAALTISDHQNCVCVHILLETTDYMRTHICRTDRFGAQASFTYFLCPLHTC